MDGLAIALHCFYHSSSFDGALVHCINLLGDADTTAAITAQLCGAFYGKASITPQWLKWLQEWDDDETEMRAIALYIEGLPA